MSELIASFERQPLFAVCLTVAAYAVADRLWQGTRRPALLNPVLISTTILAGILVVLGIPYEDYRRQAQPINESLALLIILLAVPLYRQFWLIRKSGLPLIAALAIGSTVALATALLLPAASGTGHDLVATIAPKSATAAVAVEVSERLGGLPALTAVIVISTGIFGAVFGPMILDSGGVKDHRAKGFALGVGSHAIGTARAFQISETAGAFASVGMILNALLTIALAPVAFALITSG
jgi:predicted murein hydrolase (TIGR00659 family)